MSITEMFSRYGRIIDSSLENYITEKDTPEGNIYKAMRYSLMAGGKRLRPMLSLAVCEMLGGNESDVIPFACAIEMIHTYSLIHDDLPAMDNDDYRRGKPTNHKVFGEAMAVLAGDALLNTAFEVMIEKVLSNGNAGMNVLRAMNEIASGAGTSGMIGGQVVDIESEGKSISEETLNYMHKCKTGALIKASVIAPAYICGASEEQINCLDRYARGIGLAFQIKDDILNVEGDSKKMGKSTGSDAERGKSTYVTIHGLEKAKEILNQVLIDAVGSLEMFGEKAGFLKELAKYIASRET